MSMTQLDLNDDRLAAFIADVRATILDGKRHQTNGFGTFSSCTRKASLDRPACTIAMFRAAPELRAAASGGTPPLIDGPHCDIIALVAKAICEGQALDLPQLGHMAAVPVSGKQPKLIFHGDQTFNDALSNGTRG